MPSQVHVTSAMLWRSILIVAPVDVVFVSFLASWVRFASLRKAQWLVAGTTAGFVAAVWTLVVSYLFWDRVYHYFFPEWSRWLLPVVYGLGFGAAGFVSWWLALRLRGNAVVNFCALLGFWGAVGHVWAVHRGLMDKPPMLRGASPEAAVIFSWLEFVFYAGVILAIAQLLNRLWQPIARSRGAGASR
jgi:hypothetical protein